MMTANSATQIGCAPKARLLVSARSISESKMVIDSGAGWLDLKEPLLGSLGRPSLELVFAILQMELPQSVQVSVAGGELLSWTPDLDDTLAAKLPGRAYLKLALADCNGKDWQTMVERISHVLVRRSQLILVHYADCTNSQAPHWQEVIETAKLLGGKYVLIDTHCKKFGGLLDHYTLERLEGMIRMANKLELGVALAGSLKLEQLKSLSELQADWLGVRGAVCQGVHRTGDLCPERLKEAIAMFPMCSSIGS